MEQVTIFDDINRYQQFINYLIFQCNFYKNTKAIYSQTEIADYLLYLIKAWSL